MIQEDSIAEQKRLLRRQILERQEGITRAEIAQDSIQICARLRSQPVWQESKRILAFFPMEMEPDIRPLLEEALAAGKTVALPWFDRKRGVYEARAVREIAGLGTGHFGIPEPGPDSPSEELNRLDFCLVPGVAYDRNGRRLGRGKGYFDRLLAQTRGHFCGVAFEWQLVMEVPIELHDVCVNSLLTPSRWYRCAGRCAVL
jgi:5-formyltetrahydrofolate cyclo-ligase